MDKYKIVDLKNLEYVNEETTRKEETLKAEETEDAEQEDFVNVSTWKEYVDEHASSDDDDSLIVSFQFIQGIKGKYEDTNMLLDTGSNVSVIKNEKMLINIRDSKHKL